MRLKCSEKWRRARAGRCLAPILAALACLAAAPAAAQSDELPNRRDPIDGITASGQPSAEGLATLADEGYEAVIDLRAPGEDRGMDGESTVESLGMSYVNLPVEGPAGVTYENADALDRLLAEIDGPVLIHCASGNRVGALLALRARLNGADSDAALELGLASGLSSLRPLVETLLAEEPD